MAIMAIGFSACNDNDGYSIGDIGISWATVHTLDDGKTFYLDSDNYGSLWLGGSRVPNFTPKNGERVVAVFNPLYDNYQGYDMAILLERLYPVLTKDVLFSTTEDTEELGNSPITIYQGHMWVAAGYLNLIYQQNLPSSMPHSINLVYDENGVNTDNEYINLSLHYNDKDDVTNRFAATNVSFDLSELDLSNKKGIYLTINSAVNGEVHLRIDIEKGKGVPATV